MKLCDICGDRHEAWQAHRFTEQPVANVVTPVANRAVSVANDGRHVANQNPDSFRVQVWREANRERYNARQRELMRKRRSH